MRQQGLTILAAALVAAGAASAQTPPPARPAQQVPKVTGLMMMQAVMPSADFERSKTFYVKGLGMTASTGANPRELVLAFPGGGSNLMLLLSAAGSPPRAPGRAILQVPDMKAFVDRLTAAGFQLKGKPVENAQYHISIANVEDPDGNAFEIIARGQ